MGDSSELKVAQSDALPNGAAIVAVEVEHKQVRKYIASYKCFGESTERQLLQVYDTSLGYLRVHRQRNSLACRSKTFAWMCRRRGSFGQSVARPNLERS